MDLFLEVFGGRFEGADFVFHVFFLLLGLEGLSHAEGDRGFVEGLVGLNGLGEMGSTERISSRTRTRRRPRSAQLMVICRMSSSKHWL